MTDDLFESPAQPRPEPKRDRWGRYVLSHPATGTLQSWQRVTTFARTAADGFGLEQWKLRMALKGAALRPDLVALAASLDVKADAKHLNQLAEQAREAAGGSTAANLGTAIHALTESVDLAQDKEMALASVPAAQRPDVAAYLSCLDVHGIVAVPDLVERITCVPRYDVAGTLDRVLWTTRNARLTLKSGRAVELRTGDHVIGDVKTGRDLSHSEGEIAVQLHSYAEGVNEAGVWNHEKGWQVVPRVRDDVAFVMHVPAGSGLCALYVVDLAMGREAADLCVKVRDGRKVKGFLTEYEPEPFKLDLSKVGTGEPSTPSPYGAMLDRFASIRSRAEGSALYREACKVFGPDSAETKRLVEIGKAALG